MPEQYRRPYLDSSVYIAAIKGEEGRAEIARDILTGASRGEIQIVAATFVIAEVIRMKGTPAPLPADQERVIDGFLMQDYITWVELDVSLAQQARRAARTYGLKPADAVHLVSAARGDADVLLRWDDKFRLDEGGTYEGIAVHQPYWMGSRPFDLDA